MLNVFTTKKFFVLFSSSLLLIHVGIFYNNYVQHFVRWAIIIWAGKHTDVLLKFWGSEWTCLLLVVNLDWKFETINLLTSFNREGVGVTISNHRGLLFFLLLISDLCGIILAHSFLESLRKWAKKRTITENKHFLNSFVMTWDFSILYRLVFWFK